MLSTRKQWNAIIQPYQASRLGRDAYADLGTDDTLCEKDVLEKNKILNVMILWIENHEVSTDYILQIFTEFKLKLFVSLFTIK